MSDLPQSSDQIPNVSVGRVLKNSGLYSLVNVLQKGTSFLLLPVYTAYLVPEQYGIVGVVNSILSILVIFATLSLNGAASRLYFEFVNDKRSLERLWGTITTFVLALSGVLLILFFCLGPWILKPVLGQIPFWPYMAIGLGTLLLAPVSGIYVVTLQVRHQGEAYARFGAGQFLLGTGLTVFFIVVLGWKAEGFLVSALLTSVLMGGIALRRLSKIVHWGIDRPQLIRSLKYSLPLVPHSISAWLLVTVDRIMLNIMLGTRSVGMYNVGFQFGNIINIVTNAVNIAFVPWFFAVMKEGESGKKKAQKFAEIFVIFYGMGALGVSWFGKEVIQVMTSTSFHDGWKVAPFIAFAYAFTGVYYFLANVLFYHEKATRYIPLATISSSLINVSLTLIFIPAFGYTGAAVASMISRFISGVLVQLILRRRFESPFSALRLYSIMSVFFLLAMLVYIPLDVLDVWQELTLKCVVYLIVLSTIFWRYRYKAFEVWTQLRAAKK